MRPGGSTLNPFAAAYIPLADLEAADIIEVPGMIANVSHGGDQTLWYGPAEHATQNRERDQASSVSQVSTQRAATAHGFSGSSSQNPNEMTEKLMMEEQEDMELHYLQMQFPGISDESLSDVYMLNKCDLEETIEMLKQLEAPNESPEILPDTLDIGDVSESGSVRLKNVVGEANASSSGSTASESITVT